MKISFNIECSPEEARQMFGLPDLQPMQEAFRKDIEQRMTAVMNPQKMMAMWSPLQGAEQMQKMFWSQIEQTMSNVANMTGMGGTKAVK